MRQVQAISFLAWPIGWQQKAWTLRGGKPADGEKKRHLGRRCVEDRLASSYGGESERSKPVCYSEWLHGATVMCSAPGFLSLRVLDLRGVREMPV